MTCHETNFLYFFIFYFVFLQALVLASTDVIFGIFGHDTHPFRQANSTPCYIFYLCWIPHALHFWLQFDMVDWIMTWTSMAFFILAYVLISGSI
jgi:hypothetical protein